MKYLNGKLKCQLCIIYRTPYLKFCLDLHFPAKKEYDWKT